MDYPKDNKDSNAEKLGEELRRYAGVTGAKMSEEDIKKITSCSCTGCEKLCTENCACKSLKMEILIKYFKFVLNNNYNKNMYLNKEGGINGK